MAVPSCRLSCLRCLRAARLVFPAAAIALLLLAPCTARALVPADVTITFLSGAPGTPDVQDFVVDNQVAQCNAGTGPQAAYVGYRITNATAGDLAGLSATLAPTVSWTAGFGLAGGQPATLPIGTLTAAQSVELYWYVQFPCTRPTVQDFTLTITQGATTVTRSFQGVTTSMASANAGGAVASNLLGPGAVVGQLLEYTVTYSFNNVPAGGEVFLQPSGEVTFNAACFQLEGSTITASDFGAIGIPANSPTTDDRLYFVTTGSSGGGGSDITVKYLIRYKCANAASTAIPYAAALSGGGLKYTGNYDTYCALGTSNCTLPAAPALTLTKSVSPTTLPAAGGTVTYTVAVANTVAASSLVDRIDDVLPPGVTFGALVTGPGCGPNVNEFEVTAANSSLVPTGGATGAISFQSQAPTSRYTLPAFAGGSNGTLVVCYTAVVPGAAASYVNSATATSYSSTTPPATTTVTVPVPAELTRFEAD